MNEDINLLSTNIQKHLLEQNVLEKREDHIAFTPLAQLIFSIIGTPDLSMHLVNTDLEIERFLYIKGDYFLDLEQKEYLQIHLLPSLPLVIGAYANAMGFVKQPSEDTLQILPQSLEESWNPKQTYFTLKARSSSNDTYQLKLAHSDLGTIINTETMTEHSFQYNSKENCVNAITAWMLNQLKDQKEENNVS